MTQRFVVLATINAMALLASFGFGIAFMLERNAGAAAPSGDQPLGATWFTAHIVVSLCAGVFTLLIHCIIFTYFLGTGRWVKEVARAYALPDDDLPRQTREFKRRAFPPALYAMLSTIAAVATGAGAQTLPESAWGWLHPILAILTLFLNGYAYVVEFRTVSANKRVIDQVMEEVAKRQKEQQGVASGGC